MDVYLVLNPANSFLKGFYGETADQQFSKYLTLLITDFNIGYSSSRKLEFAALTIDRNITANEAGFYALAGKGANLGPMAIYLVSTSSGKAEATDIYYFNNVIIEALSQSGSSSDLMSTLSLAFTQFAQISVARNSGGGASVGTEYSWDTGINAPIQGGITVPGPGPF